LARTVLVIGDFGPKVEYVPFEQGSETSRRRLKKPALLDVASDENMLVQSLYLVILSGDGFLMLAIWVQFSIKDLVNREVA
jgi:hypothetical protein